MDIPFFRRAANHGKGRSVELLMVLLAAGLTFDAASGAAIAQQGQSRTATVELVWLPEEDLWVAEYRLSSPASEVVFEGNAGSLRRTNWSVGGEIEVHEDRLEAAAPFDRFRLSLRPDDDEHNRIYPAVIPMGRGSLVNTSFLIAHDYDTTVVAASPELQWILPGDDDVENRRLVIDSSAAFEERDGDAFYAYAGDHAMERPGPFRYVVGDGIPAWLIDAIRLEASDALEEYSAKLDRGLEGTPTLFLSESSGPAIAGLWRGDVSSHFTVSLRFHPGFYEENRDSAVEQLRYFVRHEVFHFWNSGSKINSSEPWLHEGTADYFASLGEAELEPTIRRCWRSSSPYACGHAANLVGDRLLAESGDTLMTDVWRAVLRDAPEYDLDDVFGHAAALGAPADFREMVLAASGPGEDETRRALIERLALNPTLAEAVWVARMHGALRHVLESNCLGAVGFWILDDGLRLDATWCQGGLVDRAHVAAIDGFPLVDSPAEVTAAIARKCGTEDALRFETLDGQSFDVTCGEAFTP